MKTYKIRIIETLSRDVEVSAETREKALDRVQKMYRSCDIVLDADDFQDFEMIVVDERENKEEKGEEKEKTLLEKALDYVRENKTWTREQDARALEDMDKCRCPLSMTHDGKLIASEIYDLMETYGEDNNLPEGWWLYEADEDDIFFEL